MFNIVILAIATDASVIVYRLYLKESDETNIVYVTGFWKTYHLHTSEIIRISDFQPL